MTLIFRVGSKQFNAVCLLNSNEQAIFGDRFMERARLIGRAGGEEDFQFLLQNQHEIPAQICEYLLIFPSITQDFDGEGQGVRAMVYQGGEWNLKWHQIALNYYHNALAVQQGY